MTETLPSTPSQTVGPFLHLGLRWADGPFVVPPGTPDACWIRGMVFDGAGEPIHDALVETWQADPDGLFGHPDDPRGAARAWRGFGRSDTHLGEFAVHTVVPGVVPAADGRPQAPHVNVSIFARGLLQRVVTRIYFPEHTGLHRTDPVLNLVPEHRRSTLVASVAPGGYRFTVRLQGDDETVFFDV